MSARRLAFSTTPSASAASSRAAKAAASSFPSIPWAPSWAPRAKPRVIYLKTDNPANDQLVIDEIHGTRGLENYRVQTMADLLPSTPHPAFRASTWRSMWSSPSPSSSASSSSSSPCIPRCSNERGKSAFSSRSAPPNSPSWASCCVRRASWPSSACCWVSLPPTASATAPHQILHFQLSS